MHGKRTALALIFTGLFWAGATSALTIEGAGHSAYGELFSREEKPDFRELMISYLFRDQSESVEDERPVSVEPAELSPEERILARWREKQIDKWETLPEGSFEINASAYTAAADECGKSDGITASGLRVAENRTLACPPQYPFGAKISIEGYGIYRCEDRGGAIKGNRFDIYMETKREAFAFGRRTLVAEVMAE